MPQGEIQSGDQSGISDGIWGCIEGTNTHIDGVTEGWGGIAGDGGTVFIGVERTV